MSSSSTVTPLAKAYDTLAPRVLKRLIEHRAALDPWLGRLDDATARVEIAAVLEHLGNFIATGDPGLHRAFLHTFLAMRAAEGQSPAVGLSTLVTIGDSAAQVAQEVGAGKPDGMELTLLLTRVTSETARIVNDLIADELAHRLAQWHELARQGAERR